MDLFLPMFVSLVLMELGLCLIFEKYKERRE